MKKLILILASLICLFTVGCTSSKEENASSLEYAYFDIVDKKINKEEITEKYLKNLLKVYKYEKGEELILEDAFDGKDHIQQPYTFTNDNEELILTHMIYGDDESVTPLYSIKNGNIEMSLSYLDSNEDDESNNTNNFMVSMLSDDIKLHKKISDKLSDKNSTWSEIYYNIAESIALDKDIDIQTIKKLLKKEPSIEKYKDDLKVYQNEPISSNVYNLIFYTFENDDEKIMVEYIKEKDKIWNVSYFGNSTNKNTLNKPLINVKEKFHTGLSAFINDKVIQKELLDMIK